jgi:hypothetical protein
VIHRFVTALVVVATTVGIACVDMSAPKGAASISSLQLPSPSVVIGDSMRDSNGVAAPIRLIAFDGSGAPIPTLTPRLFVTDSIPVAVFTPGNVLVGKAKGTVRVLGQVEGLQTAVTTIPVTFPPAQLVPGPKPDTLSPLIGRDSATTLSFSLASGLVRSPLDSASQGIIVRYALISAPQSRTGSSAAVFIADDANAASVVDTSDASGLVSRRVVMIAAFLADTALLLGRKVDSAVVEATARYRGAVVGVPLRIVVPIKVK